MDVISQHFDEANGAAHCVQNNTSVLDSGVITSYWLGQKRMFRDKTKLAKNIKFECSHLSLCGAKFDKTRNLKLENLIIYLYISYKFHPLCYTVQNQANLTYLKSTFIFDF